MDPGARRPPAEFFWGGGGVGMPAEGGPARHAFGPPAGPNFLIKSALEVVSDENLGFLGLTKY